MMKMFLEKQKNIITSPIEEINDINKEIAINYSQTNRVYDQKETNNISTIFSYLIACDFINGDPEPQSIIKCQKRHAWAKWK